MGSGPRPRAHAPARRPWRSPGGGALRGCPCAPPRSPRSPCRSGRPRPRGRRRSRRRGRSEAPVRSPPPPARSRPAPFPPAARGAPGTRPGRRPAADPGRGPARAPAWRPARRRRPPSPARGGRARIRGAGDSGRRNAGTRGRRRRAATRTGGRTLPPVPPTRNPQARAPARRLPRSAGRAAPPPTGSPARFSPAPPAGALVGLVEAGPTSVPGPRSAPPSPAAGSAPPAGWPAGRRPPRATDRRTARPPPPRCR